MIRNGGISMKAKKIIFICIFIFLIIISIFYYKKQKSGNNISKSITDFKEYILNISSYKATISVEITSNKNTNKYIIKQWYASPNLFKQEVQSPENIKGLTITYDGSNLKLKNPKLELENTHTNYNSLSDNILGLHNFINDCKETEPKYIETEDEIIFEVVNGNKFNYYKRLTLSKKSGMPTKMEIMDENKKTLVYILYNEITINETTNKDIM